MKNSDQPGRAEDTERKRQTGPTLLSFGNLKPPTGGVLEGAGAPALDELPETSVLAPALPPPKLAVSALAPFEFAVEPVVSSTVVEAGLLTFCISASTSPISKAARSASSSDVKNESSGADSSSFSLLLVEATRWPVKVLVVAEAGVTEDVDGIER